MARRQAEFGLKWPAEKIAELEREIDIFTDCMSDLHKRGVRVLPGGDYGAFITAPMGENARDLEIFVDCSASRRWRSLWRRHAMAQT